jgi:hypothetical protein
MFQALTATLQKKNAVIAIVGLLFSGITAFILPSLFP